VNSPVISQRRQRWISAAILAMAAGLLVIAVVYGDDDTSGSGRAGGLGASASETTLGPGVDAAPAAAQIIEGLLPESGEASACREAVGVDLAGGYGARLTINGIEVEPEEMNVNLDGNGNITNVMTPTRTLGQFTFQPDEDCPNGRWLRPLDNVLEVCVYRFDDPSAACTVRTEYVFDAL
jgi:hypothetical protein